MPVSLLSGGVCLTHHRPHDPQGREGEQANEMLRGPSMLDSPAHMSPNTHHDTLTPVGDLVKRPSSPSLAGGASSVPILHPAAERALKFGRIASSPLSSSTASIPRQDTV